MLSSEHAQVPNNDTSVTTYTETGPQTNTVDIRQEQEQNDREGGEEVISQESNSNNNCGGDGISDIDTSYFFR
jgi:hypothetical protein